MKKRKKIDRISFLIFLIFIFFILIFLRLFDLQILNYKFYQALALESHKLKLDLLPKRGEIYTQSKDNLKVIATNKKFYLVYAIPKDYNLLTTRKEENSNYNILTNQKEEIIEKLSTILEIPKEELLKKISKDNDFYEPLKHFVSEEKVNEIEELKIKGVGFEEEWKRFYSQADLFSHLLGFLGYKNEKMEGRYGLEEYFESLLAGKEGKIKAERDALGKLIFIDKEKIEKPKEGADLILTLNYEIQFFACQELSKAVQKHRAEKGSLIVMEPKTGKLLALCNYPNFDPNEYSKFNQNLFLNSSISESYEPGSIFKVITMASALNEDNVEPETSYIDEGEVKIGNYIIKNSDNKKYGKQTMIQVLEKSLNTGAIFAARKLGIEKFREYVENFGFGEKTKIELPGEIKGDISSLKEKNEIYLATSSFGQGISVTPLQLITAFSALANEGKLMKPYLVEKIIYKDGKTEEYKPEFIRQIISSSTANTLNAMLVSVVENGHGKRAQVKGYYIGGKTGTAQVSLKDKRGYDPNKTIGSFIGFPVTNPKFVVLAKIDYPKDVIWAESSAAPLVGQVLKFLLEYYQVPPER